MRIQSWVRRHLALKNWPKLRLSLQQARQQRGIGPTQQHPGLDRSAYDVRTVCDAAAKLQLTGFACCRAAFTEHYNVLHLLSAVPTSQDPSRTQLHGGGQSQGHVSTVESDEE